MGAGRPLSRPSAGEQIWTLFTRLSSVRSTTYCAFLGHPTQYSAEFTVWRRVPSGDLFYCRGGEIAVGLAARQGLGDRLRFVGHTLGKRDVAVLQRVFRLLREPLGIVVVLFPGVTQLPVVDVGEQSPRPLDGRTDGGLGGGAFDGAQLWRGSRRCRRRHRRRCFGRRIGL